MFDIFVGCVTGKNISHHIHGLKVPVQGTNSYQDKDVRYQSLLYGMLKQSHVKEQTVTHITCNCEVPGEIKLYCLDYIS